MIVMDKVTMAILYAALLSLMLRMLYYIFGWTWY